MISSDQTPSPDRLVMLDVLRTAVNKALDKKKRLGQYAVIWSDNKPTFIGPDAPRKNTPKNRQNDFCWYVVQHNPNSAIDTALSPATMK